MRNTCWAFAIATARGTLKAQRLFSNAAAKHHPAAELQLESDN